MNLLHCDIGRHFTAVSWKANYDRKILGVENCCTEIAYDLLSSSFVIEHTSNTATRAIVASLLYAWDLFFVSKQIAHSNPYPSLLDPRTAGIGNPHPFFALLRQILVLNCFTFDLTRASSACFRSRIC